MRFWNSGSPTPLHERFAKADGSTHAFTRLEWADLLAQRRGVSLQALLREGNEAINDGIADLLLTYMHEQAATDTPYDGTDSISQGIRRLRHAIHVKVCFDE